MTGERVDGWINPKEDDRRRWKWKRAFWPDSEVTERENKTWMRENVDGAEQKARDNEWKSAVRWKWYGGWNGHTGWSLSPPLSLYLSPPLSPREADTSLHPFDRSQKGGWIEEWRGVKERDEWRRKRAKGGWAADGHLNARLPIYWKNGREGWSNINMVKQSVHNAATHLFLVDTCVHKLSSGVETQNCSKTLFFQPGTNRKIEMLVQWASWWPSSLRDVPCNHDILVEIWPRHPIHVFFFLLVFPVCFLPLIQQSWSSIWLLSCFKIVTWICRHCCCSFLQDVTKHFDPSEFRVLISGLLCNTGVWLFVYGEIYSGSWLCNIQLLPSQMNRQYIVVIYISRCIFFLNVSVKCCFLLHWAHTTTNPMSKIVGPFSKMQ